MTDGAYWIIFGFVIIYGGTCSLSVVGRPIRGRIIVTFSATLFRKNKKAKNYNLRMGGQH